ncbi:substrate-binding domain-containing protein [Rhabdochromatium marinum]|uniref:substrate-binding domain-containing protein n=1 Tax=Rhabdochromatium marinum TaxID=48729 RepID=UPI001905151A|nr:substrate-binding domain-containing protein [Rhabdochromatium marinum]MBK1649458.1 phosphate ABC transporter substrate-binding protein [Rhabdochromatium marinum]
MKKTLIAASVAASLAVSTQAMAARDYIYIVGSSTVFPFATVVAETFGKKTDFNTPKIESTGSGGGMKLFCEGVGVEHPDITNASRRMKVSEFEKCQANGVEDITEVVIGYDGIAVANAKDAPAFDLSLRDIFLALAKDVPNPDNEEELIANPYKTWKEVNADLPDIEIEVLGPPPTSGTRDAFAELAMEGGCKTFDSIKAMKKEDKKKYKAVCHGVREDGAYIEAGENDNLIVQKLEANPDALGIFGFSFLDQNADKVKGAEIDGIAPTFDSIADGSYPVSRSLYFYVKKAHVGTIPGIEEYVTEFTSDTAWSEDGYLADKGLIPLSDELRAEMAENAQSMQSMSSPE